MDNHIADLGEYLRYCASKIGQQAEKFLEQLKDPDPKVRAEAAKEFGFAAQGGANTAFAVPALTYSLLDEDMDVRRYAACSLRMAAEMGADMSPVIVLLVESMRTFSGDGHLFWVNAYRILGFAAQKGADISIAVKPMTEALHFGIHSEIIEALKHAAVNEKSRDAALDALVKVLENEVWDIRRHATDALCHAAGKGTDITAAIPLLVKSLSEANAWSATSALSATAANRKSASAAMVALVNALEDQDEHVSANAANALAGAAEAEADMTVAVPALINALLNKNEEMRMKANIALKYAARSLADCEKVKEFEEKLQEGYSFLVKGCKNGKNERMLSEARLQISKLRIAAAQKKDKLARDKGILLTDIPKPPKRGTIYRQMEMVRNG
jgi:HEAT repeat protein